MQYWLMKSEPTECSIDDLSKLPQQTIEWFGIRNYQARNFMRDTMQVGDLAFFWHSSCKNPGIYGEVKIISPAHPDSTQFILDSDYYDPKSSVDNPRWWCVDVQLLTKTKYLSIDVLRKTPDLINLQVLKQGNRLSITPVSNQEWAIIQQLLTL